MDHSDLHDVPQKQRERYWPKWARQNPVCSSPGCEERDGLVLYLVGLLCKQHRLA